MPCVFCSDGCCPSDCPALELFPRDKPFSELSCLLAQKLMAAGFKTEFIMDCLRAAKVSGGLDAQKDFVSLIILRHEFMCRSLSGDLAMKLKIIAEIKEANDEGISTMKAVEAQLNLVKGVASSAVVRKSTTGLGKAAVYKGSEGKAEGMDWFTT